MRQVVYALVPGAVALTVLFGVGILINAAIAVVTALAAEAAMLRLRQRPIEPFLRDYSAVVTALLLALALPPIIPWWATVIGTLFAIVLAKHLYGGLGFNPFNPAMVGYVVLLISFPREMIQWIPPMGLGLERPGLGDTLSLIFLGRPAAGTPVDAITQATPLDILKTELGLARTVDEVSDSPLFGHVGAAGWEWVNLAFLAGGAWLLIRRVITWHIPVGVLGGLFGSALIFHAVDPGTTASPGFHLFSGATMLGAFFIATDPVSAATTPRGRLIYGGLIGVLIYLIRAWGGYPDGVAFAVLLLNIAVPTIDYYTQPRVLGERSAGE
jgi:electron transport complex protein RnfD